MSGDSETAKGMIAADESLVANAIRNNFERLESGLNAQQAAAWLVGRITEVPVEGTKVISIVGGPGSGKSTLVSTLIDAFGKSGQKADSLGTDDYVLGTRAWRWEHERDDPLKLKDFDLLNQHIEAIKGLKDGETIATPSYDPETGLAIEVGEAQFPHQVGRVDILLIEGDFDATNNPNLRLFIDMPANARMQTRIGRDLQQRGEVDAGKVADSFKSRHEKQFIPHTAPAIEHSDVVLQINPVGEEWQFDIYQANPSDSTPVT